MLTSARLARFGRGRSRVSGATGTLISGFQVGLTANQTTTTTLIDHFILWRTWGRQTLHAAIVQSAARYMPYHTRIVKIRRLLAYFIFLTVRNAARETLCR
jgi:ABC-type uncharacterized transport system involved in gliding motility auxiliary subunit